ncbi:Alpha/Beta hydrolase protein [Lactarius hatsudake]|nr:Alpha/Beta hydrolase protein [Lactarius hatsudake]
MAEDTPTTFPYKQLGDLTLYIDVYPPTTTIDPPRPVPAVIFFHGGGMTVGHRKSWLPKWLCRRTTTAGLAFISADYRLLPPSTGHDVLKDVVDLFAFLARTPSLGAVLIDGTRLAVAGSSAGGMCAFLAAVHANPRPRAVLSLYGLGGDLFTPHFLVPKTAPFFLGYEILDPAQFTAFLYPGSAAQAPTAQSTPTFHGRDSATPGLPSNPRMPLARLWLQLGTYLDYWTGLHTPSLSDTLRTLLPAGSEEHAEIDARLAAALPPADRAIFPQLLVTPDWPPVLHIHGSEDSAVPADSSRAIHARLLAAKVETVLRIVDGSEHAFDHKEDSAEATFGGLFDEAVEFLRAALVDA